MCSVGVHVMPRRMLRAGRLSTALLFATLMLGSACSGDDPGTVGERCVEGKCAAGLYCAAGGDLAGYCTADCDSSTFCRSHFGENTVCLDSVHCTKLCAGDGDCQGDYCGALTDGEKACYIEYPDQ